MSSADTVIALCRQSYRQGGLDALDGLRDAIIASYAPDALLSLPAISVLLDGARAFFEETSR